MRVKAVARLYSLTADVGRGEKIKIMNKYYRFSCSLTAGQWSHSISCAICCLVSYILIASAFINNFQALMRFRSASKKNRIYWLRHCAVANSRKGTHRIPIIVRVRLVLTSSYWDFDPACCWGRNLKIHRNLFEFWCSINQLKSGLSRVGVFRCSWRTSWYLGSKGQ